MIFLRFIVSLDSSRPRCLIFPANKKSCIQSHIFLHLLISAIMTSFKIEDLKCKKCNLKAKVDEASLKLREDVTRSCWVYNLHHSFSYHNPS